MASKPPSTTSKPPGRPARALVGRARRSLTRLTRFTNRLQRMQLSCGPVTPQQCHAMDALTAGPLPMNKLAEEVALHQSTLTRVVEKLEAKGFVTRERPADNQRVVQVNLTDSGRAAFEQIDAASDQMIGQLIALIEPAERAGAVRGLEVLCELLDPRNARVHEIIASCCCAAPADSAAPAETRR